MLPPSCLGRACNWADFLQVCLFLFNTCVGCYIPVATCAGKLHLAASMDREASLPVERLSYLHFPLRVGFPYSYGGLHSNPLIFNTSFDS